MLPQYRISTFFRFSLDDVILVSLKGAVILSSDPKYIGTMKNVILHMFFAEKTKPFFAYLHILMKFAIIGLLHMYM